MNTPKPRLVQAGAAFLCLVMAMVFAWIWSLCVKQTDGHFTYVLDDPYIHLSIARNFALHGVWGVTPFAPSAASSSPLWILILAAAIRLAGDWVFWPLLFNLIAAFAAILVIYYRLIKIGVPIVIAMVACGLAFAAAPFHLLPFTGMEHSLQVLLDVIFGFWVYDRVAKPTEDHDVWAAFWLTALMCGCRYESVFLIVVPFIWMVFRKEWRLALAVSLGPIFAIGGFGFLSHLAGMPWIPNSIVLKGNVFHIFSPPWFLAFYLGVHARSLAMSDLGFLCVLIGLALLSKMFRRTTGPLQILLWTVVVAFLLHAAFASVGIFYRYEAYLLVLGMVVAVLGLVEILVFPGEWGDQTISKFYTIMCIAVAILAMIVVTPIFWTYQLNANLVTSIYAVAIGTYLITEVKGRTMRLVSQVIIGTIAPFALYAIARGRAQLAFNDTPMGSHDIYIQQRQMSRFVARYYPNARVTVNDIGAVTYYTHIHLFDLWGLATDSVRDLKLSNTWTTKTMDEQLRAFKPDIVIAYQDWYKGWRAMPSWLIPVGTWTIPPVTSAARTVVVFFAPSPASAIKLKAQLKEFQPTVPAIVKLDFPEPKSATKNPSSSVATKR